MLNLYRLNYYTTTIFLLAGGVLVLSEKNYANYEFNLPNTAGHSHKNIGNTQTADSKNKFQTSTLGLPAENSNPHRQLPTDRARKNDTQQYHVYMQVAETILAMLRLSPLLAQEVQRCLNESNAFHEIMSHLPHTLPSNDSPLAALGKLDTSKKAG